MSIYLDESEWEDVWHLLTPCDSGNTLVGCETRVALPTSNPTPELVPITIILPNLIDRVTVTMEELRAFVALHVSPPPANITINHLLIYLFLQNQDTSVTCINNLKLLHTGRQYTVQQMSDLRRPSPALAEVMASFPTFQLFLTTILNFPQIRCSVDTLLYKSNHSSRKASLAPPVTYAESMMRILKKTSRRRSSSDPAEPRRPSWPTRTALNDSSTDVDEICLDQTKSKFRRPWKRVFRRQSLTS